ncbi:uncharacterized protein PG986_009423 [Apiospora aurea]|uniref:Apple domain-containing protein n=1 Tax=Apiospora aurea TaxID=335848 RepID=A0ABR1Q8B6_9PEZI
MKGPVPTPFLKWLAVGCCVSTAVLAQSSVTCPANNGDLVVKGNKQYELQCGQTVKGAPFKTVPCSDALVCAEHCANDAACVHSTFNSVNQECLLKTSAVTGKPHAAQWTRRYVGPAPPSNPPAQQPPAQQPLGGSTGTAPGTGFGSGSGAMAANCPADDGKTYTTPNGITYQLKCDHNMAQAGALRSLAVSSLQQCADTCSQDPQCVAMDFIASNSNCYLKTATGPLVAQAGVHSWIPQTCPSTRPMVANTNPAIININTDLICPQNDGKIFEAADGTWYYLQCCTDTAGAVAIDAVAATSHADCIEKCAADKKCKSATYATWGQTNCKLYGYNQFSTTHIPQIHHAFVTDPPTTAPLASDAKMCSTECPYAHGQLFVSPTGENFQMTCDDLASGGAGNATAADCPADDGKIITSSAEDFRIMCGVCALSHGNTLAKTAAGTDPQTLAECAEACAREPSCASANLLIDAATNAIVCPMHKAIQANGVDLTELKHGRCNVLVKQSGGMVSYAITP